MTKAVRLIPVIYIARFRESELTIVFDAPLAAVHQ
jgi:hypothetical protein